MVFGFDFVETVVVVGVLSAIIPRASYSARCASTVPLAAGRRVWMDWPRLRPSVTIFALSCANGMSRLFDTLTAATNCPRLRKPADAVIRSVPAGKRDESFAARFVFFCSFACTGVSGVVGEVGLGPTIAFAVFVVAFAGFVAFASLVFAGLVAFASLVVAAGFVTLASFVALAGFAAFASFVVAGFVALADFVVLAGVVVFASLVVFAGFFDLSGVVALACFAVFVALPASMDFDGPVTGFGGFGAFPTGVCPCVAFTAFGFCELADADPAATDIPPARNMMAKMPAIN